jgi:1-acyl-sn-glycerol-3-phosphate acyltransferase
MTVAGQMTERLKLPIPVLLFPEGTSTDGHMLPFHPGSSSRPPQQERRLQPQPSAT